MREHGDRFTIGLRHVQDMDQLVRDDLILDVNVDPFLRERLVQGHEGGILLRGVMRPDLF